MLLSESRIRRIVAQREFLPNCHPDSRKKFERLNFDFNVPGKLGTTKEPRLDTCSGKKPLVPRPVISGPSMPVSISAPAANRLARICAYSGQAPEWEQFVRMLTPVVLLAAKRVGSMWGDDSAATLHEIAQEVFLKLCENERRILREFEDRGNDSFLRMLRMISASVATDHFRHSQAEKRGGRNSRASQESPPEIEHVTDRRATENITRRLLIAELDGLLKRYPDVVSERDRNMFWLYYRHGLTADAISRIPAIGLSTGGVESALRRLTKLLREVIASGKSRPTPGQQKQEFSRKEKGISPAITVNSVKEG
jgi:RNA polymerase sigma-70 factor, ECF subfamily